MNEEMQAHLDGLTERNLAAGTTPDEARYAALRTFGGVAQIAEKARDERRSIWFEQLGRDVRYAVRSLARSPSFTITAVLTLGLGIGVNAALFSIYNMVALRPLPVRDPNGLVTIAGRTAKGGGNPRFSHEEYRVLRAGSQSLEAIFAYDMGRAPFRPATDAQREASFDGPGLGTVGIELVSENYFSVLGGTAQLGRTFLPEECRIASPAPVIVLSHLFWQRYFHGNPNVVGTTLTLRQTVVTVIGVAPPEFSGQNPVPPAGWLPLTLWSRPEAYGPKGGSILRLVGRLKPGITEAQAKADLDPIMAARAKEFPGDEAKTSVRLERGLRFISFTRTPQGLAALGMLFLGFGLVLVIACTNVANLLLARGVSRQAEIGVRLTLGASRGRIVRQLLTENFLICGLGAILGLGLATWTLQLLLPLIVSRLPVDWALETRNLPFFDTTPDLRVFGFTALLTIGASLVAGLLPAWHSASTNLIAAVHNQGTAFGRRITPSRLRQILVISQVAVCLMLLSCAGVLARNFFVLKKVDVGFDAHAVFGVNLLPNAAIADRNIAFRQAFDLVRTLPGVAASAVADTAPLLEGGARPRIRAVNAATGTAGDEVTASFITDGFFDTFRIPLRQGRTFREAELTAGSRVVIVSEALARRMWPGQNAVGQVLAVHEAPWSPRERPAPADAFRECTVIGVARDVMISMMQARQDNRQLLYLPMLMENPLRRGQVFIRARSDSPAALAEIVRMAEAGGLGLQFTGRHSEYIAQFVLPFYGLSVLSGALGVLALSMAAVGLYGLMTFSVSQRVREIGIRMALGATAERVVALFVRQGLRLVALGLAFGLIGGGLCALALSKIFFGFINAFDPAAFGAVTGLFALIAWFACWLPARRATKVDPMIALRAE